MLQNCKQISAVISDMDSNVQGIVDSWCEQDSKVGAKYVNIEELSYSNCCFSSMNKITVVTFYLDLDNKKVTLHQIR